ncbi:MAG: response regulator [Chloroflexi bacterium]|nr:response regulator [Chloroflexota bacterium]
MKKILVVDDDSSILEVLQMMLEEEHYLIETTAISEEIYQRVDDFRPDLILLDVLMTGIDGRIIARTLKQQRHTRHIPIIMLSATPTVEETARNSGGDEFVAKPFEIDVLLMLIEKYVRR